MDLDPHRGADPRCPNRSQLLAFHLAEIADEEIEAVAAHLAVCTKCRSLLSELEREKMPILPGCPRNDPLLAEPEFQDLQARAAEIDFASLAALPTQDQQAYLGGRALRVMQRLPIGGAGLSYMVQAEGSRGLWLLKVLPKPLTARPIDAERYLRDVRQAVKRLGPGIVGSGPLFAGEGAILLLRPYLVGPGLEELIQAPRWNLEPKTSERTPSLSLERLLPALDQFVERAGALHRAGIVHGGLRPGNLIWNGESTVVLTDCGIHRLLGPGGYFRRTGDDDELVVEGAKPGYHSPEEWSAAVDQDYLTDVFSLGVSLYRALAGKLPYGTKSLSARHPLPPPPSQFHSLLPLALDPVLLRAIHPDRRRRYPSAAELAEDWALARRHDQESPGN